MSDWLYLLLIIGIVILFGVGYGLYNQYRNDELNRKAKIVGIVVLFLYSIIAFSWLLYEFNRRLFYIELIVILSIAIIVGILYVLYKRYRTDELDAKAKRIGNVLLFIFCALFIGLIIYVTPILLLYIGLLLIGGLLITYFNDRYKEKKSKQLAEQLIIEAMDRLMDKVEQILLNEGFRPERNENQICFKYEGRQFNVDFDERDSSFFSICHGIYIIGDEDVDYFLRLANKMNYSFKYTNTYIFDNNVFTCAHAYIEEYSNIGNVFFRLFGIILETRDEIIKHSSYRKETSMN